MSAQGFMSELRIRNIVEWVIAKLEGQAKEHGHSWRLYRVIGSGSLHCAQDGRWPSGQPGCVMPLLTKTGCCLTAPRRFAKTVTAADDSARYRPRGVINEMACASGRD